MPVVNETELLGQHRSHDGHEQRGLACRSGPGRGDAAQVSAQHRRMWWPSSGCPPGRSSSQPQQHATASAVVCRAGVRATSFDEAHVERLLTTLNGEGDAFNLALPPARAATCDGCVTCCVPSRRSVVPAWKKLQVILDTTGEDGRLHDQYLQHRGWCHVPDDRPGCADAGACGSALLGTGSGHVGAVRHGVGVGQRTAGLRMTRQVFTATDPKGRGWWSVTTRQRGSHEGLAWQAGRAVEARRLRQRARTCTRCRPG